MKVKVKFLDKRAKMPVKKHDKDFCYDIYAIDNGKLATDDNGNEIQDVYCYRTGLAFELVRDEEPIVNGQSKFYLPEWSLKFNQSPLVLDIDLRPRSGIFSTGLVLCNSTGTVDEGYRGEVKVYFYHVKPDLPRYKKGDRIAQMKIGVTIPIDFEEVEELSETERGTGGFNSTGRNDA